MSLFENYFSIEDGNVTRSRESEALFRVTYRWNYELGDSETPTVDDVWIFCFEVRLSKHRWSTMEGFDKDNFLKLADPYTN